MSVAIRASLGIAPSSARVPPTTPGSRPGGLCTASARSDVIAARFGSVPPLTIGVEEEIMILDGQTLDQVAGVDRIVSGLAGRELPGRVKTELHASIAELN